MARYFIGLMVPAAIQQDLVAFTETIQATLPSDHPSQVSWNAPADLHCTLVFIGQTDQPEQYLEQAMYRVAAHLPPITVNIGGTTHWLGRNSLALAATGAEQAGTTFVKELGHVSSDKRAVRRPFYGHVTLGRVHPVPVPEEDVFVGHHVEPLSWTATHVHLVKGREGKVSPRYETVSKARLNG